MHRASYGEGAGIVSEEMMELLDAHRDGGMSAGQRARLRQLLASDPAARRVFVEEQLLEVAFDLERSGAFEVPADIRPTPTRRSRLAREWRWAVAAVVIFSVGIGLGGLFGRVKLAVGDGSREPMDDGIALLTQSVDAVWRGDCQPQAGDILAAGKLELESGLVQLDFYSGARLILDGKGTLEIVSASQAVCHSGRLRALVPPQARGFSVLSPRFRLVDLGTEFGMEIGGDGSGNVQVFDGEVELHENDQVHRLFEGDGLLWTKVGDKVEIEVNPSGFPSSHDLDDRIKERSAQRFAAWQQWNESLADDTRVAVRYDFQDDTDYLRDSASTQSHGLILGCERSHGRWAEKSALEFKRPSDRVRVDLPGTFDTLTLMAWIRVDALPNRRQALLLTDEYQVGRVHWQIGPEGELRLGARLNSSISPISPGYASPILFTPARLGMWNLLCSTYDRQAGWVQHFFNGRKVSSHKLTVDLPWTIGAGDIGNWSKPLERKNRPNPVRNFVGRIDELTVWNTALTADEIYQIYVKTHP
jgi:hypothetical protein